MAPGLVQEVEHQSPPTSLHLNAEEASLRRLLLDVAKDIDDNPQPDALDSQVALPAELARQPVVLRFTGGWVRDKLLGVPSHDIDVSINKMTGYQFGLRIREYLDRSNPDKYRLEGVASETKQSKAGTSDSGSTVGGLHKIDANPEKSKHLETVTTRIFGLDVDLVNLRKETYTEESRNPQMEFGTPEEDALRRDATVNAMFYNINTCEIEDFTGKGHDDMAAKILRTPMEPFQTFKDDPLRVLRLIRFAGRLGYTIERGAMEAMQDQDIKDALRRKISRERVGTEVEKMLKGPDPGQALKLIFDLDLYEVVFSDPTKEGSGDYRPDTEDWEEVIQHMNRITSRRSSDAHTELKNMLLRDPEELYMAWQLCAILPYRDAPQAGPAEPGRKPPAPIAAVVAREGIKAPNKVCDVIAAAVRNQLEMRMLVIKLYQQKTLSSRKAEGEDPTARDVLGMAVRRWGPSWRSQCMYALLVMIADDWTLAYSYSRYFAFFLKHLKSLDILDAYAEKPLLDGKALAKALCTPPGPWMKDALDVVMAWQLRTCGKAAVEEAVEEVRNHQKHGELTSSLIVHFLRLTIRPLFAKTQPQSVTAQGRKDTTGRLAKKFGTEDEAVTKAWKGKDSQGLALLEWVLRSVDAATVEQNWPFLVPPLLTLTDDWEPRYKTCGAETIGLLLEATPPTLLARTGLGEVFEEALIPCLSYLPTVTPEEESIPLLAAVYPTLLVLAKVRYPKDIPSTHKLSAADMDRQRVKFLDAVIRKGILHGYSYCGERPAIVEVLLAHLPRVLDALGIASVKHLQYILPMLSEIAAHALASARPATLLAVAKTMQSVILNAWPRMAANEGEVLKCLTFCWLRVFDLLTVEADAVRREARTAVQMLRSAVGDECDVEADLGALIAVDARLEGLFDDRSRTL